MDINNNNDNELPSSTLVYDDLFSSEFFKEIDELKSYIFPLDEDNDDIDIQNQNDKEMYDVEMISNLKNNQKQQNTKNKSKIFEWETYLMALNVNAAPIQSFINTYSREKNHFNKGMKLEAIDPENNSLFCVCTVQKVTGYRLKLHFDGYSDVYDFWINANSNNIFPPGWCEETNRILRPPNRMNTKTFSWSEYLKKKKSIGAPRSLFKHLNSSSIVNPFKVDMKLEADKDMKKGNIYIASVADVLNNRILIHFDGFESYYAYWIDINSVHIHPVNWHKDHGFSLTVPTYFKKSFKWEEYIDTFQWEFATEDMFSTRELHNFKPGMRLEVVDKKNKSLIRPATILNVHEYEIEVVFDGWPLQYAFWIAHDSTDIYPINWCKLVEHELEPPPGYENLIRKRNCPTPYCTGIGNENNTKLEYHTDTDSCPYTIQNWFKIDNKSRRFKETKHDKVFILKTKHKNETFVTKSIPNEIHKMDTKTTGDCDNINDNNNSENYKIEYICYNFEDINNFYENIIIDESIVENDENVGDNNKNDN